MRFTGITLSLLFVPLLALAQNPELGTITPDTIPTTGGIDIVITGSNLDLPPDFACVLECPPRVRFGDREVAAHEHTNTRVVVKAPPHPAGLAGVTLTTGDGRTVSRPAAVTYTASPEEAWELVLIPIQLDDQTHGANGSVWITQFWLRNNSDAGVAVAPWPCPEGQACPPVFPSQRTLMPGEVHDGLPRSSTRSGNPGRLLFLSNADVSFGLRVLDASRSVTSAGTEIPVVRASQLRTSAAQLLNVPFEPSLFRYSLRIYDTARVPARFFVRVYEQRGESHAGEVFVTTSITDPSPLFPFEPAYAAIDIAQAIPRELAGRPLRIEVVPLDAYSRFWPMLTITSSLTQNVALVTPQ